MFLRAGRLRKAKIHHPASLHHLTEQRQTKCHRATGLPPGTRGALQHVTSNNISTGRLQGLLEGASAQHNYAASPSRHLSAFFPYYFSHPFPSKRVVCSWSRSHREGAERSGQKHGSSGITPPHYSPQLQPDKPIRNPHPEVVISDST